MTIDQDLLARLEATLRLTPRTMILHFLKYKEVSAGTGDSKKQIVDRLLGYVQDGTIEKSELSRTIIDFPEYQNKTVYLFELDTISTLGIERLSLPNQVGDWSRARIAEPGSRSRVSYSIVTGDRIHVSFVEQHDRVRVDYETDELVRIPKRKIVVLSVDAASGFCQLRLDPPEPHNPHGGRLRYFDFYVRRSEELLQSVLRPLDIRKALLRLEPSDLVELPWGRILTRDGMVDLKAEDGYRSMGVYATVNKQMSTKHSGRYTWLQETSVNDALLRDVPTEIAALPRSMIRFTKDVVRPEVEYVIQQIRAHA